MSKNVFTGILYVSIWVIIWGSLGSLIDFPLLKSNVYIEGSIGQILTFTLTAIVSIGLGTFLFPKLINNTSKSD